MNSNNLDNLDKATEVGAQTQAKPKANHPWRQHRRPSPNMATKKATFWERQMAASTTAKTSPWTIQ